MLNRVIFLILLCLGTSAIASVDLAPYQAYLSSLKTLKGSFIQTNANGSSQSGLFYLSRPGKMRLDYLDDPRQQLMADGTWIIHYDEASDEVNYTQLEDSPAHFLLKDKLDLIKDVHVLKAQEEAGLVRITFALDPDSPDQTMTLVFEKHPLHLRQWTIKDVQGQETQVYLSNLEDKANLDPALFMFDKKIPASSMPQP